MLHPHSDSVPALDGSPFAAIDHACAHVLSKTRAEPTRAREGSTFVRARRVGEDAPVVAPAMRSRVRGPRRPGVCRWAAGACRQPFPVPAGLLVSSVFLGRGGGEEIVVSGRRDVGRRKFGDGDGALGLDVLRLVARCALPTFFPIFHAAPEVRMGPFPRADSCH